MHTPKDYNPYNGDPKNVHLNLGNLHWALNISSSKGKGTRIKISTENDLYHGDPPQRTISFGWFLR